MLGTVPGAQDQKTNKTQYLPRKVLPTGDSLHFKKHTETESKETQEDIS